VPTGPTAFRPAPGGSYRLASTGQVVTDPFLLTSWMITVSQDEEGRTFYEAEPNFAPLAQSRVPKEWELTYVMDEGRIRRVIEVFGDDYIGKSLLLCINHLGAGGELRRQEQVVGTIMWVDYEDGVVVSCEPGGRQVMLSGDLSWIEKAPPAEYRLRSTGEVVTDPDYLTKVTIRQPD
jgi:hypothetical protein